MIRRGEMNFITRSKDVCHVRIVELVPVTRSSNELLISRLTAGCSGRESKYVRDLVQQGKFGSECDTFVDSNVS